MAFFWDCADIDWGLQCWPAFSDFYRFWLPSWPPKSTQNAPKIDKKLSQKDVGNMMLCLIDFFDFWWILGPKLGAMLGLCWPEKLKKSGFKKEAKKVVSKNQHALFTPGGVGPYKVQKNSPRREEGKQLEQNGTPGS